MRELKSSWGRFHRGHMLETLRAHGKRERFQINVPKRESLRSIHSKRTSRTIERRRAISLSRCEVLRRLRRCTVNWAPILHPRPDAPPAERETLGYVEPRGKPSNSRMSSLTRIIFPSVLSDFQMATCRGLLPPCALFEGAFCRAGSPRPRRGCLPSGKWGCQVERTRNLRVLELEIAS